MYSLLDAKNPEMTSVSRSLGVWDSKALKQVITVRWEQWLWS